MLGSYALMSFDVYKTWNLRQEDSTEERASIENIINSASLQLCDVIGKKVIRTTYTDIINYRQQMKLKNDFVQSLTSVTYDASRAWDGENDIVFVLNEDYFWTAGRRYIKMLYNCGYSVWQDTMQIVYVAGKYRLDYRQATEPSAPIAGEVWMDTANFVYKLYSTVWTEISEDLVIDAKYINALVEIVTFNKARQNQGGVGRKSITGNGATSFYQQVEIEIPKNVITMLQGEMSLI